jgi:hypothetical protein
MCVGEEKKRVLSREVQCWKFTPPVVAKLLRQRETVYYRLGLYQSCVWFEGRRAQFSRLYILYREIHGPCQPG